MIVNLAGDLLRRVVGPPTLRRNHDTAVLMSVYAHL
jgi:hypothetical protein